jgi:hypothetical protein
MRWLGVPSIEAALYLCRLRGSARGIGGGIESGDRRCGGASQSRRALAAPDVDREPSGSPTWTRNGDPDAVAPWFPEDFDED